MTNQVIAERGMMTNTIKEKSNELFGYEITQDELWLIPYVLYCLQNSGEYEMDKLHEDEMDILEAWEDLGYIETDTCVFTNITKEFFDAMNELLYLGIRFTHNESEYRSVNNG